MTAGDMVTQLREAVRSYLGERIAPRVTAAEQRRELPWEMVEAFAGLDFVGAPLPEPAGSGLGCAGEVVLLEELGRCWGSLAVTVSPAVLAGPLLAADPHAWQRWGADVAAGRVPIAVATRTGGSAGPADVVNGGRAGVLLVLEGATGVSVYEAGAWSAGPARRLDCLHAAEVVPVVAEPGAGSALVVPTPLVRRAHRRRSLLAAATAVGLAGAALDLARSYAAERHQFGRPIASFGEVHALLGRAFATLEAGRALVSQAAGELDEGGGTDARCRAAHLFCAESALDVTTRAQHVHGGYGHMREFPVGRYTRDVRGCAALDGLPEAQLRELSAALGLPVHADAGAVAS